MSEFRKGEDEWVVDCGQCARSWWPGCDGADLPQHPCDMFEDVEDALIERARLQEDVQALRAEKGMSVTTCRECAKTDVLKDVTIVCKRFGTAYHETPPGGFCHEATPQEGGSASTATVATPSRLDRDTAEPLEGKADASPSCDQERKEG